MSLTECIVCCALDYNECNMNNGGCEDSCRNTDGSYQCNCRGGFRLGTNMHECEGQSNTMTNTFSDIQLDCSGSHRCL